MTLQAPPRSPRQPEDVTLRPPAPGSIEQTHVQARPQHPAFSLVFPQVPTEPRPAALIDAAGSHTHSVGPTSHEGARLGRDVDGALVGANAFVDKGGSGSHVDLCWVGRARQVGLESTPW